MRSRLASLPPKELESEMSAILAEQELTLKTASPTFRLPSWLAELRDEVGAHPGVNHLLLSRLRTGRYTKSDYKVFGLQHYPMVGTFTRYMELLLLRAPSSEQKLWLAKVLVDEYGEGSDGDDHAKLYLRYMRSMGVEEGEEETTPLCAAVWEFIGNHLRICSEEPFLVGLGAPDRAGANVDPEEFVERKWRLSQRRPRRVRKRRWRLDRGARARAASQ